MNTTGTTDDAVTARALQQRDGQAIEHGKQDGGNEIIRYIATGRKDITRSIVQ